MIDTLVGGVLGGIGSIFGSGFNAMAQQDTNRINKQIADQNLGFQRDKLAYDKGLQERMFMREDNAVVRRSQDLANAGLSQTLAAGGGANAGPVVKTEAPQNQYRHQTEAKIDPMFAAQMAKLGTDISMSRAQEKLITAQAKKTNQETDFLSESNPLDLQLKTENVDYTKKANVQKLLQATSTLSGTELANKNKELDGKLKSQGYELGEIQKIIKDNETEIGKLGIEKAQLEVVMKEIMIEVEKYDKSWYGKHQLPSDASVKYDDASFAKMLESLGAGPEHGSAGKVGGTILKMLLNLIK